MGDALDGAPGLFLSAALVLLLLGWLLHSSSHAAARIPGILLFMVSLSALGAWRIAVENAGRPSPELAELASSQRRVEVFARVDGTPYQKPAGWRVPLELIGVRGRSGNIPVTGRVLLTSIPSLQGIRFGDYLRFEGRIFAPSIRRNPGGFDYADYLRRQGFDATVRPESPLTHWPQERSWSLPNIVDPLRRWIRGVYAAHLDDNAEALLTGLLLGDTDRLPQPVYDAFRESGTSHLLAVSGANVWLVVGMILLPMYWLAVPRWPRTLLALGIVLLFSFLTRNEPSVVRASLMVSFILAGQLLWRPVAPLNAVGAAALLILLIAPAHLFRPGFQLSFAAVIGILVAVARIEPRLTGFWRRRGVYAVTLFLVASVAATVATAPVSAWQFGTVPIAGVLSNLIMVPLAGLTAHLGLLLLAIAPLWSGAATILAWLIDLLLNGAVAIAGYFAAMPYAVVSWPSPSAWTMAHLVLATVLLFNIRRRYSWLRPLIYYAVVLLAVMTVSELSARSVAVPSISLLDTGGRRVAIISDRAGAYGLVDDPGLDDELSQWILEPFLRHALDRDSCQRWEPWRRMTRGDTAVDSPGATDYRWTRYVTAEVDSTGAARVLADLWHAERAAILMYRDVPHGDQGLPLNPDSPTTENPILVVPAAARPAWVRQVIDANRPSALILYGSVYRTRDPSEMLAFWQLRYPHLPVYLTGAHGGITIELRPDGPVIRPTVDKFPPANG